MRTGFFEELWRELHRKFAPHKEVYLRSYPPLLVDTTRELLRVRPSRDRRVWALLVAQFAILLSIPLCPILLPLSGQDAFAQAVGNELAFAAGVTFWPLAIFVSSSEGRIWAMRAGQGDGPGVNLALHVGLLLAGAVVGLSDKSAAAQPSDVARGASWGITLAAFADLACLAATLLIAFYRPLFTSRR